jgi:hypothetical protein
MENNNHKIEIAAELPLSEAARLKELERIIGKGQQDIGAALREIRNQRFYRATHTSFEEYCQQRWEMSHRQANRLIQVAEIADNVGQICPTQRNANAALLELAGLKPPEQRGAWKETTKKNPKPTAKEVRKTIEDREDRVKRHRRRVELNGIRELLEAGEAGLVPWARLEFIIDHCPKSAQLEKLHEEIAKEKYKAAKLKEKMATAEQATPVKAKPPKGPSLLDRQRQMHAQFANSRLPELTREQVDPNFKGDVHAFTREYGHVQLQTKAERDAERAESACIEWIGALKALDKPVAALLAMPSVAPEQLSAWIARGDPVKRRAQMLTRVEAAAKFAQLMEQYRPLVQEK